MEPKVRYCTAEDGVRIAYTVTGSGPPLVLMGEALMSHVELEWSHPLVGRFLRRLAERSTLIRYDDRQTGLSDRGTGQASPPYLDLEAVVAKVGLGEFALAGVDFNAIAATTFAALHPERVTHLVLVDGWVRAADILNTPQAQALQGAAAADFTLTTEAIGAAVFGVGREESKKHGEYVRKCIDPDYFDQPPSDEYDATEYVGKVVTPTLVLRHTGLQYVTMEITRELAAAIPDSTLATVEGMWADNIEGLADRILDFAFGTEDDELTPADRPTIGRGAGVTTVLFTDIVGHTEMMQRLGDDKGRDVLREHERITRETLKEFGGDEVKTMGDGFMASFASVTGALDCAIALQRAFDGWNRDRAAASTQTGRQGSGRTDELKVRIGLNAGEPIEEDGDLFGSMVILASRIAAKAGGGEILIPEPVRHLLTGKSYEYADRGETVLKGSEDAVRLFEVRWRE